MYTKSFIWVRLRTLIFNVSDNLFTLIDFQVFLFKINNFQLFGFMYSLLMQLIFDDSYLLKGILKLYNQSMQCSPEINHLKKTAQ